MIERDIDQPLQDDSQGLSGRLKRKGINRRDALWLMSVSTGAAAVASMQGCAKSPITGKNILVGMSEDQERKIDQQVAPHQFSKDLGAIQEAQANNYIQSVGGAMAGLTHRPDMPYNFRVLNANYVNAYTFPGGAMGLTRGIVTEMKNEAELAALLGHEFGHVNARHAAQRQGQAMVAQIAVVGVNVAARDSQWGSLAGLVGQIGASALLSSYSRENEREADALGQEYMVRAGYPASGMVGLHQLLVGQHSREPNLLETMFSTHPMPAERVKNAQRLAQSKYKETGNSPIMRERFMDSTSRLRAIKPTIKACQKGEMAAAGKKFGEAEQHFSQALRHKGDDYAANLLMAKTLMAQKRNADAQRYADIARRVYPEEAQAHKLAGVTRLVSKDYAGAFSALDRFDKQLPGDPGVTFLKGVTLEGTGDQKRAAQHYYNYLQTVRSGNAANYAANRLQSWGMVPRQRRR